MKKRKKREGLESPTARVSITEAAPNPDQIVQQLTKDPARLPGVVQQLVKHSARLLEDAPFVRKGRARAELEAQTIGVGNKERQRKASADYRLYRQIAASLITQHPRLRRASKLHLARLVRERLVKKQEKHVSLKTIVRALTAAKK